VVVDAIIGVWLASEQNDDNQAIMGFTGMLWQK
jgi:hypothetical protein